MQVQIKFTSYGACAALGAFSPGDTARVPADLAEHLVKEMKAARYTQAQAEEAAPAPETAKPTKPRKAKA